MNGCKCVRKRVWGRWHTHRCHTMVKYVQDVVVTLIYPWLELNQNLTVRTPEKPDANKATGEVREPLRVLKWKA